MTDRLTQCIESSIAFRDRNTPSFSGPIGCPTDDSNYNSLTSNSNQPSRLYVNLIESNIEIILFQVCKTF